VYGRHTEGLGSQVEQKFLGGEGTIDIAKEVGGEVKDSVKTEEGQIKVDIKEEELDKLQDDLFRVLRKLSATPNYREGVEGFFKLLEEARDQFKSTDKSVNIHARRAQVEAQEMVASFAGRETFYAWLDGLKDIVTKFEDDETTREYLSEVKEFILLTKDADHVSKEEYKQKGRELVNRGRDLIQKFKYDNILEPFFDKSDELLKNIRNNETLTVLRHHAGLVAEDLSFLDTEGKVQINTELIAKLRDVIIPNLAESLKYVPLPRFAEDNQDREYWIDNIVVCGYDIIPENIRFQIESDSNVSLREAKTKQSDTRLVITLSKIRTELKDLQFFFHKKTFPEFTEQGKANVKFGGDGATLNLVFNIAQGSEDKVPKLTEGYADFHISKMEIEYEKQTLTHDIIVPLMTNLWNLTIQNNIEHAVEKNLTDIIHVLAEKITQSLTALNKPLHYGLDTVQNILGTKEFSAAYQHRMEKLE